jgi:hypothetical protein
MDVAVEDQHDGSTIAADVIVERPRSTAMSCQLEAGCRRGDGRASGHASTGSAAP